MIVKNHRLNFKKKTKGDKINSEGSIFLIKMKLKNYSSFLKISFPQYFESKSSIG